MGKVEAVCISARRGEKKKPQPAVRLIAGHGVEGDAHAGSGHRQLSVLAAEDTEAFRRGALPGLQPGDFAENLILSGVPLRELGLGSRIRLGVEAEITITQLGKACHQPCPIYLQTGDCIMPRLGVFARVTRSGRVSRGDGAEVLKRVPRDAWQAVVLTISDRCSRGEAEDVTGPAVARILQSELGAHVYTLEVLPDDQQQIRSRLLHYSGGHSVDLVITAGGTGFSPRDVTPEAVASVIERPTPGLDEAMRRASGEKTPAAMLSRCVSGIRGGTLILSVPGSERAAAENLQAVLAALPHGLAKLRGDPSDCGRS